LYASWTEGYLPAGFNYASAQGLNSFTFAKETSTNIEIGYKTKGFSDKLTFKSALFHIKTRDKQIVDLVPGFVQFISNAAETSSYGAEISANYQWENQWKSFIHVGTLNATADNFLLNRATGTNLNIINLNGNDMPFSPDISYGLGIEYQPNLGWFTKIAIAGKSDYYFDVQNTLEQPSSIRVDMALGYHFERFSVTFRADNLFNEEMYSRAVRTPVGIVVEDTNPRYFGLTIAARW
jgi:iron complex outermembrane receptor protein